MRADDGEQVTVEQLAALPVSDATRADVEAAHGVHEGAGGVGPGSTPEGRIGALVEDQRSLARISGLDGHDAPEEEGVVAAGVDGLELALYRREGARRERGARLPVPAAQGVDGRETAGTLRGAAGRGRRRAPRSPSCLPSSRRGR